MKQFPPEEVVTLLKRIDTLLVREIDRLIIGGAAASLAYGATKTTTDIDLASSPSEELLITIEQAKRITGIDIPIQCVGVFEPPYSYEDRLFLIKDLNLTTLRVFVPERHDLALMKTVRGFENDLQTIEQIHKSQPLDFDVLMKRFLSEMTQVNADPRVVRLNFLLLIERLFGTTQMNRATVATRPWSPLSLFPD